MELKKRGKCTAYGEKNPPCHFICCEGCTDFTGNSCGIQSKKPHGCVIYPHNPMALESGCSFYFMDDDGAIVTPDNFQSFPEEARRRWLELTIEEVTK